MTGGTITKTGGGNFIVGASGPGTMVQSAGLVDIQNGLTWVGELAGATTATLTINGSAEYRSGTISVGPRGPNAVLNLDGGTVRTNRFSGSSEDGNGFNTGNGTINFNGSQIIATANNGEFTRMVDTINLAPGGMLVDTNGFTLTAPVAMSGPGGVVKSGAGSLSLTGANSYTGATAVNEGTLALTTDATGGGALTVADGAALGLTQATDTGVLAVSNFTLGNADFDLAVAPAAGNPAAAAVNVTGTLALNGQVALHLVDESPVAGLFPVVSYAAKTGTGSIVAGSVPDGVVLNATTPVVDNGSVISLNIDRANAPYWMGNVSTVWNTTTANWRNGFTDAATTFANGDPVLFEDLFNTSIASKNVLLNSTVIPGGSGVTVDNDVDDYSISGTGKISGTAGLTKRGFARVTLSNTGNDFTGPVVIEEGTVQVSLLANAGSPSPLGAGDIVLAGGTLDYTGPVATVDRGLRIEAAANTTTSSVVLANNVTLGGPVTATLGKLAKTGTGTLTLSHPGDNVLGNGTAVPGAVRVDEGTLALVGGGTQINTVTGEFWVGSSTFANATLTLNGTSLNGDNWLSISRGNGTTGLTSTVTATNSSLSFANVSLGFDAGVVGHDTDSILTLTDSTFTVGNGNANLGESGGATATITLNGNSAFTAGSTYLALNPNSAATLQQNGGTVTVGNNNEIQIGARGPAVWNLTAGTVNASGWTVIGRYNVPGASGEVNVSGGTFNQVQLERNLIVGEETTGTLTVSGTGVVNAASDLGILIANGTTGTGTINLDGGTLSTKRIREGAAGSSTFNFNGGTLIAAPGANPDFMSNLDSVVVKAGGAFVETDLDSPVAIGSPLAAGTGGGGLTKSGTGTLQLNAINGYTGTTTVTAGTLAGTGSVAGPVVVQSGAALAPGATTGTFSAGGNVTFNAGSAFVVTIDDSLPADNGTLAVTGNLNLTGAALQVNVAGNPGAAPYTIATFGTRTGTFASVPAGVTVTYNANSITINPPAVSGFDAWISGFEVGELTGKTDDADGDGLTNLEEFALDGNPATGAASGKVRSRIETVEGQQALVITFPVRSTTGAFGGSPGLAATDAAGDVRYEVLGSNTLAAFDQGVTEIPASTAGMPALSSEDWTYKSFRLDGAIGGATPRGPKGFLTVTVEDAP